MGYSRRHEIYEVSRLSDQADDSLVEPTMQVDIYGDKPWALAPVLASMNYLSMTKDEIEGTIVEENVEGLTDRKKHFANEENRKATSLKDTFVGMEFANGFLGEQMVVS